jgi:cobalt-zinc-cadmium efflux system protein
MQAASGHEHAPHLHAHAPVARAGTRGRLALALGLALVTMLAEVVGGLLSGSLALLADAGHMLSDVAALALALFAAWVTTRPSGPRWTYGRVRAEILAALVQGVALIAVAVLIGIEAIERLAHPRPVVGPVLFGIAAVGFAVNAICLWLLSGDRRESLNVRGAWLHVLSDALGSVGAMTAGVLVWAFGLEWADPAASLAICALVLFSAWHLLRDVVDVLMEAAPRELDVQQVQQALLALPDVKSVHDLHVWTLGQRRLALSCHLVVSESRPTSGLLSEAYAVLGSRFGIEHATLQVEPLSFAGQTPRSICHGSCLPEA